MVEMAPDLAQKRSSWAKGRARAAKKTAPAISNRSGSLANSRLRGSSADHLPIPLIVID